MRHFGGGRRLKRRAWYADARRYIDSDSAYEPSDRMVMARVPGDRIRDRAAYEFFARTGRYPLHLIDTEVEMVESDELPGDLSGRGHANLRRAEEVLLEAFDDWRNEVESAREVGGGRVLVFLRFVATGKGSGVETRRRNASVNTVKDGRITRVEYYTTEEEARAAAGLPLPGKVS